MRIPAIFLLVAAFALRSDGVSHCVFDAISLDGEWEMAYWGERGTGNGECPIFEGQAVAKAVPGYWENMIEAFRKAGIADHTSISRQPAPPTLPIPGGAPDMTLPGIRGCFLYKRRISLDRASPALLAFEGVRNSIRVWANGTFVGSHTGFSTPFELEVPHGILKVGENTIILAVSNAPVEGCYGAKVSGLATRGFFASTGGVCGRVELRFPKSGLGDVYVTTAADLKSFTVHLRGARKSENPVFRYAISDWCRKEIASGEATGDFDLPADGFEFWSPERPVLYALRITTNGGAYSQRFGLRRLAADGEMLRLNGKPVYLRGVTEHCYFPETVHPPRDIGYYRRLTARRKELGFNFVRFHTWVPPEAYLDAMDELGMLVHMESPNFTTVGEYGEIVAFARRHPCVVIYCTGNETRIDRKAEAYLKEAAEIVHSGTDAVFSPVSAMRGVEYALVDGMDDIAEKPFRHNPTRMSRLADFCDIFTSYQLGAVNYDALNGPSAVEIDSWGDAYCGKPRLSHEICIDGSYADLSLEKLYPNGSPIVNAGLFSEVRHALSEKGLQDRAERYHRNSCEWMRRIRKFTFEKMRSSQRTAGYDFLGDINTHWHTFGYFVGMMDEFLNLKPGETVENVRRYNSAAVLLSDLGSDFNVWAGEKKRVKISISNYADDAEGGVLGVALVREGEMGDDVVWAGEVACPRVPCGDVLELGGFDVDVPDENGVRKYFLRAKFASTAVTAENEWEIYAFPTLRNHAISQNLTICHDISCNDLVAAMECGEHILLLGTGPFKSLPTTFRIGLAGRCSGNYATVIKSGHPALHALQHDGFCGWQFRRLMEGARAVQLEADVPFDPIIDVASSEKFPIRQAMLFEYRVGEGKLLVCSFSFSDADPAAVWLKTRLVEYASSDAFKPSLSLSVGELQAVVDAPLLTGEGNRNRARNPNDPASLVRSGAFAEP